MSKNYGFSSSAFLFVVAVNVFFLVVIFSLVLKMVSDLKQEVEFKSVDNKKFLEEKVDEVIKSDLQTIIKNKFLEIDTDINKVSKDLQLADQNIEDIIQKLENGRIIVKFSEKAQFSDLSEKSSLSEETEYYSVGRKNCYWENIEDQKVCPIGEYAVGFHKKRFKLNEIRTEAYEMMCCSF